MAPTAAMPPNSVRSAPMQAATSAAVATHAQPAP